MKREEFIDVSIRMVKEYCNRYVTEYTLKTDDIKTIKFEDKENRFTIILITPYSNKIFYEVTYDKLKKGIRSYIYRNDGQSVVGKEIQ